MLLILTHENADFDALASQLAAHKLYPEGVPLLSWRVNRNVNQFLALYWEAFEFTRPEDWQRKKINRVLLVDTLSLPSVRGLRSEKVDVHVIDHHELVDPLNDNWTYHLDPVGATTTLLVEMLQESGIHLTVNEATLLLLGIHEDTGSFVYDTTTARDVQAAAWLIERGAQLAVVRKFLNIPLSPGQQLLYKRLEDSIEWLTVQGHHIALASVQALPDFDEEISAVAHWLRDALSPDGLFLLVALKHNHVQLVARSSSDNVDVSLIARELGGGGHNRAAAATIMDRDLTELHELIVAMLPQAVKPMTKVSQIMSYGVQTVPTTATVFEAAEQMQRFGHEGYPIVSSENNTLVGLLTRRFVDRAISHQLGDLPVSQVMRAGNFTVRPSDSVEKVQKLMIEEGWGQIPVIPDDESDEEPQKLIGIVTRTDLINLLNSSGETEPEPDFRNMMAENLPKALWDLVGIVGDVANKQEMPLYFVGGVVRDLLLKKQPADIDMVVEGDAINLVKNLKKLYGGEIRSHSQFGTAKWLITEEAWQRVSPGSSLDNVPASIDFVTARTEFYTEPTVLPSVEQGSIKLDLHRRDFTINTLAVRLDGSHLGELLDFYGGRRDLENGLIRVLHSLSFIDDPTRILRAVRLEQRLKFNIVERTAELIESALPMLDRVTGERIRNELEMCLLEDERVSIMVRLSELGILAQIHPGLIWHSWTVDSFFRASQLLVDPEWKDLNEGNSVVFLYFALWLLPLSKTIKQEVMDRLKVRRETIDDVLMAAELMTEINMLPDNAKPSQVVNILRTYRDRIILVVLAALGINTPKGELINLYIHKWRMVRTSLTGDSLLEMGLRPGPDVGRLLDRLLAARLDGEVSDEEGERDLLGQLIK